MVPDAPQLQILTSGTMPCNKLNNAQIKNSQSH